MTKRFALPDTPASPYFTIDAAQSSVTVQIAQSATGSGRVAVEIWRDGQILCRVFAASVRLATPDQAPDHTQTRLQETPASLLECAE
jgi:hypothetical protein